MSKAVIHSPVGTTPITTAKKGKSKIGIVSAGGSDKVSRNLNNALIPLSIQKARKDITDWRAAEIEALAAYLPYRYKMQMLYEDTKQNDHVAACVERRKNLTLLRDFALVDKSGEINTEWTEYFEKRWFKYKMLNYMLDALFYGYNLISIGDIKGGIPINPTIIRRWDISPDRTQVSSTPYNPNGWDWNDAPFDKFHIFVSTYIDNGTSNCGYGLFYPIAKTEILHRNNLAFNTDFVEMFAQPYRVLRTSKTEGAERDQAEQALQMMGHAGYLMLDLMDELEFMDDGAAGNGYKSYNDFEHRLEAKISKFLLGHADAIDSVPGKLGSAQMSVAGGSTNDGAAATPIARALRDIQTKDGDFIIPIVNEELIPRLRDLGVRIPEGLKFKFLNDSEERAIQDEKNSTNQKFATIMMTAAQAGKKFNNGYAEKAMGLPDGTLTDLPMPLAGTPNPKKEPKEAIKSGKPLKEASKKRGAYKTE